MFNVRDNKIHVSGLCGSRGIGSAQCELFIFRWVKLNIGCQSSVQFSVTSFTNGRIMKSMCMYELPSSWEVRGLTGSSTMKRRAQD